MLFFIIVLCTSTNIVQQMIENLHARVQVGWKILLALRKNYKHLCKCACVKWSTARTKNSPTSFTIILVHESQPILYLNFQIQNQQIVHFLKMLTSVSNVDKKKKKKKEPV